MYTNKCPECGSGDVTCRRHYGCVYVLFTCVSMGLALFLIPLLPKYCTCKACGLKWKA